MLLWDGRCWLAGWFDSTLQTWVPMGWVDWRIASRWLFRWSLVRIGFWFGLAWLGSLVVRLQSNDKKTCEWCCNQCLLGLVWLCCWLAGWLAGWLVSQMRQIRASVWKNRQTNNWIVTLFECDWINWKIYCEEVWEAPWDPWAPVQLAWALWLVLRSLWIRQYCRRDDSIP